MSEAVLCKSSIDLGYLFEERLQYSIHKLRVDPRVFIEVGVGSFGLRRWETQISHNLSSKSLGTQALGISSKFCEIQFG